MPSREGRPSPSTVFGSGRLVVAGREYAARWQLWSTVHRAFETFSRGGACFVNMMEQLCTPRR